MVERSDGMGNPQENSPLSLGDEVEQVRILYVSTNKTEEKKVCIQFWEKIRILYYTFQLIEMILERFQEDIIVDFDKRTATLSGRDCDWLVQLMVTLDIEPKEQPLCHQKILRLFFQRVATIWLTFPQLKTKLGVISFETLEILLSLIRSSLLTELKNYKNELNQIRNVVDTPLLGRN